MPEGTSRLLRACVSLARTASEVFRSLAAREEDGRLRACWERRGRQKEEQARAWSRLARIVADGTLPPLLEHSDELVGELEGLAQGVASIVPQAEAPLDARNRALLALRLESHLLHPAIETLSFLLRTIGHESPEHDAAEVEDGLVLAVAECAKGEPDLELMARTALQLWRRNRELLETAHNDPVTGLHNWPGFWTAVLPLAHLARCRGEAVAVLTLDVVGFKAINESLGHEAGDAVLRGVAEALRSTLRGEDVCCRMGGARFVAFLTGADATGLRTALQRLAQALENLAVQGHAVHVSLGTARAFLEGDVSRAIEHLMYQSEESLEAAKQQGLPLGAADLIATTGLSRCGRPQ